MPARDVTSTGQVMGGVRASTPSPLPCVSLSREHITDAFQKSKDGGATLDLSHRSLTNVGEDGAEELASAGQNTSTGEEGVVRIALSHNRLTTLPMAFTLLANLRYLVLKNNNFTIFPDVLTVMQSLEILDISQNKIKRLPSHPGSLVKLKVFSLSRNRVHKLPAYLAQFLDLDILRVDQNPLEWPPKDVVGTSVPSPETMKDWIKAVQDWITANSQGTGDVKQNPDHSQSTLDDGGDSSVSIQEESFSMPSFMESASTHLRSFSMDSDVSLYSDVGRPHSTRSRSSQRSQRSSRPPRLHLGAYSASRAASTTSSPMRSPDSYLPTPAESISSSEEETKTSFQQHLHGRNASYAGGSRPTFHSALPAKKSMPDMRPTRLSLGATADSVSAAGPSRFLDRFAMPSPPHRQESDSSNGSNNFVQARMTPRNGTVSSPVSLDRPAPAMEVERNSYFRRFSTLKPFALSKAIPESLLTLVDAVRGILFGVSQIYQTLRHYTVDAIDERLSTVLLKVLDPASTYMTALIQALDRFDSVSRRGMPPPSVCRTVVETCRDTVTIFGKTVGVLALQLKVLATHDDVRFTRQMLTVLYGAMAEIGNAWKTIAGQIDTVKQYLREHRPPPVSKGFGMQTPSIRTAIPSSMDTMPVTAPPSIPASLPQPPLRPPLRSNSSQELPDKRARLSRRHAGSFSYKDLEIGKMLVAHDVPQLPESPVLGTPIPSSAHTPTLRTPRKPSTLSTGVSSSSLSQGGLSRPSTSSSRWDSHSRQSSQSSFLATSISSLSFSARTPTLDSSSATTTIVDRPAIEAMKLAVDAAPAVWDMMNETLRASPILWEELAETLSKAKAVTETLREAIRLVENGDPAADRQHLRDDARAFVKLVIQLSNAIKTHGSERALSSALRTNMVKLTNATQDFVMLLHVSSFSPAPTPRAHSPMIGPLTPQPGMEDTRLGASLSRSRSAIPSPSMRPTPNLREPPRSALPHQSFKLLPPPRLGILKSPIFEDPAAAAG